MMSVPHDATVRNPSEFGFPGASRAPVNSPPVQNSSSTSTWTMNSSQGVGLEVLNLSMNSSQGVGLDSLNLSMNSSQGVDLEVVNLSMNSSQEVDLEALNLSMMYALMPTILYLVVIMVVGVVGNTIVLLVYYRRFQPSSTRTYILVMSVCDLLTSVLSVPSEILILRYYFSYDLPLLCKTHKALDLFLMSFSVFTLVTVATDRFIKVCLKKQLSTRRIRINVLICALAALTVSIFYGDMNGSRTVLTGVGNTTGVVCTISDAYKDTPFPVAHHIIANVIVLTCVMILSLSYGRIALELWRHKKRQTRTGGVVPMADAAGRRNEDAVPDNPSGPVLVLGHSNHSSPGPTPTLQKRGIKTLTEKTTVFAACGSDKSVQVSFKGLNPQQPDLSNSSDACCSGNRSETLSASPIVCKDQGSNNTDDEKDNSKTFQSIPLSAASSRDDITGTPSHSVRGITVNVPEIIISEDTNAADNAPRHDGTRPEDGTCTKPHHRSFVSRSRSLFRSLLGRLLAPMTRRGQVDIGKNPSAVKAIPASTTVMMFVLTITFFLNNLPFCIISLFHSASVTFGQEVTGAKRYWLHIGSRSPFLNCAVNCIVYGFCSPRFRHECRQFFARKG